MSLVEIVATAFGLLCVWLTVRQNIWCWPTGLVMVTLYIYIFYGVRLYSDMGLQVIYVFLQIYGWVHWARGGTKEKKLPVTRISRTEALFWVVTAAAAVAALGWVMKHKAGAALPYWDAVTTVLSLVAQYLMARKLLESWLVWITVDVLSIGIYNVKGLHLTAGLYAVFLGLATAGFFAWRRSP